MPMPAGIAARPHDARGFPVLAITPWRDGSPDFAVTSPARILVCAVERPMLEVVMFQAHGNQTRAAQLLGVNRNTLRKKLKQHGLD